MELYFKQKLSGEFSFYLNADRYQCGAEPHAQKFDQILEEFDNNGQKSTVAINNNTTIDENIRKSKVLSNISIVNKTNEWYSYSETKFNESIKKIMPRNYQAAHFDAPLEYISYKHNNWDMLVYNQGDHFSKHIDGKISERHFATLLLFPPKKIFQYHGGELVLYDGNTTVTITAHDTEWMLVGFPINVEHECKQITWGRRAVFKTKFEIPSKIYNFFSEAEYQFDTNKSLHKVDQDQTKIELTALEIQLQQLKEAKSQIKEKIFKSKTKMLELKRSIAPYQYDELVKEVLKTNAKIIFVVLERRYDSLDPNYLIGEDYRLFVELYTKIPNKIIKLVNKSLEHNMHDEKHDKKSKVEPYSRHNFPAIWNESISSFYDDRNNFTLTLFQNNNSDDVPGEFISKSLSYNDETYDSVYQFKITAIQIIKM
ncbi:hypothetical protein QJ857_gp0209 [Tupanvirus soda lake]|uniref:Fe2OG dioxygenase domain-containing protein n=2 Tax=Tupanvirus TaxID=2094720 RepID=A0A6N1NNE9_9VIRU|nr:hypothetical protein QJ857_gp0209 [Tupanvirus soda lake]QKU35815.1 hypothetical protein [Tupanvirus soda lake]